jgi:hypothetical protein
MLVSKKKKPSVKMSNKNERTNSQLNCTLLAGLWRLLQDHSRTNEPVSHIVSKALAEFFQVSHSTPVSGHPDVVLVGGGIGGLNQGNS